MMRRHAWLAASAIVGLLLGLLASHFFSERIATTREPALPPGGDFTLQSADGPVSLESLRGKMVLLYFGYTSCPDVCPTSLTLTARALNLLTPAERERVRVLFVSVDPERDTPAKLKQYARFFHPDIVGVTGSAAALTDVATRYGASFRKEPVKSAVGYVMDHTTSTSVIAPDGRLVGQLVHGTPPAEIVAAIRRQLAP